MNVSPTTDDHAPLLSPTTGSDRNEPKKPTPLPIVQICVVLLSCLIEPIASQCIYPFINEVCSLPFSSLLSHSTLHQLVREIGITGGDETKVGQYTQVHPHSRR